MTYTTKTLRQQYRVRAHNIGSNAIRLVDDFFKSGIDDMVFMRSISLIDWSLADLDRALDAMESQKSPA